MVALSGGRDSSFAAYYAVKSLGLKALLYTFDNGFMPEQTTKNVKNVARLLDMDHVTLKSDAVRKNARHVMSCWVHKPSPAMIGLVCSGCQTGYVGGLVKTARKYQIPLIITGAGEPERSFAQRLLSTTHTRRKKLPLLAGLLRQVNDNPCYLSSPSFVVRLGSEFFYRFVSKAKKSEKTLSVFKYIGWSEDHILSVIQDELQWEKPSYSQSSWRADCAINELKNYLYKHTLGFTKHDELLSGMIRRQMMTRQEALQRLERDNEISRPFLQDLFKNLKLNFDDLEVALEKYQGTQVH
jgi:hypothetical protein